MLWACFFDFKKAWDVQLTLIEFSHKNNYHSGIRVSPFEVLYGRRCRTPLCCQEINEAFTIALKWFGQLHRRYEWSKRGWRQLKAAKRAMRTSNKDPLSSRLKTKSSYEFHPPRVSYDLDKQASSLQGILVLTYHWAGMRSSISAPTSRGALRSPQCISRVQLCKYVPEPTHVIKLEPLQLQEDLTYEEQLIEILDHWEK